MAPKTPKELAEQVEQQNAEPTVKPDHSRTAEGQVVPNPKRSEFLGNLGKVIQDEAE